MAVAKKIVINFLFSFFLTISLPFCLLPYGIFILPYAFLLTFIFFIPIFLITTVMQFTQKEMIPEYKHKYFGKINSVICLAIAIYIITTQRGTGEYFGKQIPTYLQLGWASFLGYWIWIYLADAFLWEENRHIRTNVAQNIYPKFSKKFFILSNLILGNSLLLFIKPKAEIYERLPICLVYSLSAILLLLVFFKLVRIGTKIRNGLLGILTAILVPILGTLILGIIYDTSGFEFSSYTITGLIGVIFFPPYWTPMAMLNFLFFSRFK